MLVLCLHVEQIVEKHVTRWSIAIVLCVVLKGVKSPIRVTQYIVAVSILSFYTYITGKPF